MSDPDAEFELYELDVIVEQITGTCTCAMTVGDYVRIRGGRFSLPEVDGFCLFALGSVLALLPAKQRQSDPADWMETDTRATCPDPACGLIMRIDRREPKRFRHGDVSAQ